MLTRSLHFPRVFVIELGELRWRTSHCVELTCVSSHLSTGPSNFGCELKSTLVEKHLGKLNLGCEPGAECMQTMLDENVIG